jgi:hypothetical protein
VCSARKRGDVKRVAKASVDQILRAEEVASWVNGHRSGDGEQVHDKDEWFVRCNHAATGSARSVRHGGGNRELAAAADLHAFDARVPPWDDLALAELELEGLPAIPRGIELLA